MGVNGEGGDGKGEGSGRKERRGNWFVHIINKNCYLNKIIIYLITKDLIIKDINQVFSL